MKEPSPPSAYFGQSILVRPETLFYRSSPISPPKRSDPMALAEQLTLTWNQVDAADEPAALAAWMVNLVRPEIGPQGTQLLQNLMEQHWSGTSGFYELFQQVALHRRQQLESAAEEST